MRKWNVDADRLAVWRDQRLRDRFETDGVTQKKDPVPEFASWHGVEVSRALRGNRRSGYMK